jgi:2,4-dienoyl-CoA reductase-like NADH-dependent reductase (Old Yellow Enzyme family)
MSATEVSGHISAMLWNAGQPVSTARDPGAQRLADHEDIRPQAGRSIVGVVLTGHVSRLFSPLTLRGTTFRNRVWVSPMCQYSSMDGRPSDWHLVHLGAFARGGAGLVFTEATAVTPEGRISPVDAGIWNDEQAGDYERITSFIRGQGAVPGIQLAHAGRKASTAPPWTGGGPVPLADGGWPTVAPSPIAFGDYAAPRELTVAEIGSVVRDWAAAATRAVAAGFEVAEVHAAHGYLLHQFLSPLSNHRADAYGGGLAGRGRLLFEVVDAVRAVWPAERPIFVRVSATDWAQGGLALDDMAAVSSLLAARGVDLVDVSSGGNSPAQKIAIGPGYQVPFARAIRAASGLPVAAVGLITEPAQAETILVDGSADAVLLARALLRDPSWPQFAARELGAETYWAPQYLRGRPR